MPLFRGNINSMILLHLHCYFYSIYVRIDLKYYVEL